MGWKEEEKGLEVEEIGLEGEKKLQEVEEREKWRMVMG